MPWRLYACLLTGSLCAACGQLLFKLGATGRGTLASYLNLHILTGLGLYALGTALWIAALSQAKLTTVYPFTALTFVLVYGMGIWVLGEAVSNQALAGVAMVLFGLFLIAAA
ncbi:MAG TPA: hypothetical protein VFV25_10065 [Methylibium sp.]